MLLFASRGRKREKAVVWENRKQGRKEGKRLDKGAMSVREKQEVCRGGGW